MTSRVSLRDAMRGSTRNFSVLQKSSMACTMRQARQSGILNLTSRDFRVFPDELFRLYDELDEDEKSWECAVLTKLDLSYNEIVELPSQIETLMYLVSFKMRHNHLRRLPVSLWSLKTLTTLDLSNNELEGILPKELGNLNRLRELGLEGNKLTQLPETIQELVYLEVLRVESNRLMALPSTIGRLKNLKTLSAHSNQIAELPMSFRSLTRLLTLDLKKNWLVTVNDAFLELTSIKYIDLRQNKLTVFPMLSKTNTSLDQLYLGFNLLGEIPEDIVLSVKESLTVLDVRDNKLQRMSSRIPELYRLKTLDVSNNELHDLPPGFGYLKYLDHFLVEGNPMRSIRQAILSGGTEPLKKYLRTRGSPPRGVDTMEEDVDEFTIRQKVMDQDEPMAEKEPYFEHEYLFRDAAVSGDLQLIAMKLCKIPDQLFAAGKYRFEKTLLQLNLSKNWLVELPAAIGKLESLRTLTAQECGLKSVNASIAMISRLEHLRLSKNALTTDAINCMLGSDNRASICSSLKELDLRNNVLTDIPQMLQHLIVLDTLLLSFNRIRTLDMFPWSSMHQLSVLSIADNRLEACKSIYQIPKLTSLSLENNELRQIPVELALCENLRALYLSGNPQRSIRAHILNNGTEAVLKYLRTRLPLDVVPTLTLRKCGSLPVKDTSEAHPSIQKDEAPSCQQEVAKAFNPLKVKRLQVDAATSPITAQLNLFDRSPDLSATLKKQATSSPMSAGAHTLELTTPIEDEVLMELNEKILNLEEQLDDFAISAAKRFALKKNLAMAQSQKIRHLRKIEQKL